MRDQRLYRRVEVNRQRAEDGLINVITVSLGDIATDIIEGALFIVAQSFRQWVVRAFMAHASGKRCKALVRKSVVPPSY
jgi:hypothetical protein